MAFVAKFGLSFWVCSGNCTWDGDSYNVAGPGLTVAKTGTWVNGYRPSKIRITATNNASGGWPLTIKDASNNTIASMLIPQGSSQVDTQVINWQGANVDKIVDQFAPGVGEIENIEFDELPVCSTTTSTFTTTTSITHFTTTTAPQLFLVPDGDVTTAVGTFGSGSARWDRMNSGILGGTPDNTNGILGLDGDEWRGTFTNPSFPGTCTQLRVRVKARSSSPPGDFDLTLYSDGTNTDGTRKINPTTTGFLTYTEVFNISKTAAQLANLEVKIHFLAPSFDDWISEVEVEVFVPGVTPTTTTSTTTTLPPTLLELDEFDDGSIAAFWNQDKGDTPGATFTEAGGQISFDSGTGVPELPASLWHPSQAGGEANITWLNQEIDALQTFGHRGLRGVDFKVPYVKRPTGWGAEGDTVGIIALESDSQYAAICKTIRGGQQFITAVHRRGTLVRRKEIPHTRWPVYFRIVSHFGGDTGLGDYQIKTQYSHTGHGAWTDVAPRFQDYHPQRYRAAIGDQASFKVGLFSASPGTSWPPTTTTVTDPPGSGEWQDRTQNYWEDPGIGGVPPWFWSEEDQAYVVDQPNQSWTPIEVSEVTFPDWNLNYRPSYVKIFWDADKQVLDNRIEVQDQFGASLGSVAAPSKSPVLIPLTFADEDLLNISFFDDDPDSHNHYGIKKVEFWKPSTTTSTVTTTTTGPLDGGATCRNQWNPLDHAAPCLQLQSSNYRMFHFGGDGVCGGRGFGKSSGKLYFEIKATLISTFAYECGVATITWPLNGTRLGRDTNSWAYDCISGNTWHNNTSSPLPVGPGLSTNDIVNVAVDLDAGKIWFGVNNSYVLNGKPHLGLNPSYTDTDLATNTIYPAIQIFNQNEHGELFSQSGLTYQPPSGFSPWCSAFDGTTTSTTVAPTTTTTV